MKEEHDKPLQALGDEALEARVVAWVLGEASPFEASELEERCGKDPELALFVRRMREVHGLIGESATPSGDEWRLPEEKRRKVTDVLGVDPPAPAKVRRFPVRWLSAVAACLMAALILGGLLAPTTLSVKKAEMRSAPAYFAEKSSSGEMPSSPRTTAAAAADEVAQARTFASRPTADRPVAVPAAPPELRYQVTEHARPVVRPTSEFVGGRELAEVEVKKREGESAAPIPQEKPAPTPGFDLASGRRSGDGAITRQSIDAVLNSPGQVWDDSLAEKAKLGLEGEITAGTSTNYEFRFVDRVAGASDAPETDPQQRREPEGPASSLASLGDSLDDLPMSGSLFSNETKGLAETNGRLWGRSEISSRGEAPAQAAAEAQGQAQPSGGFALPSLGTDYFDVDMDVGNGAGGGGDGSAWFGTAGAKSSAGDVTLGFTPAAEANQAEMDGFSGDGLALYNRGVLREQADAGASAPTTWGMQGRGGAGIDLNVNGTVPSLSYASGNEAEPAQLAGIAKDFDAPATEDLLREGSESTSDRFADRSGGVVGLSLDGAKQDKESGPQLLDKKVAFVEDDRLSDGKDGERATNYSGLAGKEMIRRANEVASSDRARDEAREAYAAGDYGLARQKYGESLALLPEGAPLVEDRRDFLNKSLADAEVAQAEDFRRMGRYDEAKQLLESAGEKQSGRADVLRDPAGNVDDEMHTGSAQAQQEAGNADRMTSELYRAESHFNLGNYDKAREEYEQVLRADPTNPAARRGMERVAAAKTDYYRAAYDQTRAELLMQVDNAWKEAVPQDGDAAAGSRRNGLPQDGAATEESVVSSIARQSFEDAKSDFETASGLLDKLKAVETGEEMQMRITEDPVIVHSDADAKRPGFFSLDRRWEGNSVIQVRPPQVPLQTELATDLHLKEVKPTFFATELEVVKGNRTLREAIRDGQLEQRLGEKEEQLVADLEKNLEVERIDGTDLIDVRYKHRDKETAKEVVEAVVDAYRKRRVELEGKRAELAREELREEIARQEERVAEKKRVLDRLQGRPASEAKPAPSDESLRQALDAMAEVAAEEEPFSTFSLHVSDASFKLASAALERGEVPDAERIRPEEFYNAFDYGDPSPSAGEPVACEVEQCAHPAFPQRNLLRIAVRTGAEGRAASVPLNLTVLLDNSGSMEREDRAAGVRNAVDSLTSLLKPGDTVTMAGFARQPRLLADRVDGANAAQLNGVVTETPSEGGTNLEEALNLGGQLAQRQFKPGAQNRVVLFTDGAANLGDADPESLNGKVEALRRQGIAFDAAGFGADGLNDRLLERLTRNGNGRYYVVDDPKEAESEFARQLAGAFRPAAENVKVQVKFNPSRVGRYKLIGFDEHRLKKEDFRNDAVDAAEMASEEAGVALYQFEILPQGEGEVGEVSVRFRDASSGRMVERTWTIPYDPQAPAFDRAKPSLQLAGLAAFSAEKLRHAPMAEAIDFGEMRGVMARLKQEYGQSGRVGELEKMMGRLE